MDTSLSRDHWPRFGQRLFDLTLNLLDDLRVLCFLLQSSLAVDRIQPNPRVLTKQPQDTEDLGRLLLCQHIDLKVEMVPAFVESSLPVLTDHQDGCGVSGLNAQRKIQEDKGVGIPVLDPGCEVEGDPDDDDGCLDDDERPASNPARDAIRDPVAARLQVGRRLLHFRDDRNVPPRQLIDRAHRLHQPDLTDEENTTYHWLFEHDRAKAIAADLHSLDGR